MEKIMKSTEKERKIREIAEAITAEVMPIILVWFGVGLIIGIIIGALLFNFL